MWEMIRPLSKLKNQISSVVRIKIMRKRFIPLPLDWRLALSYLFYCSGSLCRGGPRAESFAEANDPLNLLQVMLAKETPPPSAPPRIFMIATNHSFEPHSSDALPNSKKVYLPGALHPGLRVPLREITLRPTQGRTGRAEPNEPVR